MREIPSAYTVHEIGGRYYPMRFGRFRLDARGYRISFGRREDAVAECHNEQREYVTAYPTPAEQARAIMGESEARGDVIDCQQQNSGATPKP